MKPIRLTIGTSLFLFGLALAYIVTPVRVESWTFLLVIGCPIVGLIILLWGLPLTGGGNGLKTYYTIRDSDNLAQIKYYEQMEYLSRQEHKPWRKD